MLNLVVKLLKEENHFVLDQKAGQVKEVKQLEEDGNANIKYKTKKNEYIYVKTL
jgi:hypothetical protein